MIKLLFVSAILTLPMSAPANTSYGIPPATTQSEAVGTDSESMGTTYQAGEVNEQQRMEDEMTTSPSAPTVLDSTNELEMDEQQRMEDMSDEPSVDESYRIDDIEDYGEIE